MGNLSNLYVSQSFQSLIHLGTDSTISPSLTTLQDGYGNSIGIEVNNAGNLFLSGSLTASLQEGYVWVGNSLGKTVTVSTSSLGGGGGSVPAGTISSSAQITSLGFVSSSVTASSLITASFNNGTRNLTFTKGDNTTFSVNIPDVSGSTINTGSFATTGSNTFTGQQNIQNTLVIEEQGNPLIYTQLYQSGIDGKLYINQAGASGVRFDNVNVTMSELTASLQEGYVWVGNSSGITTTVATSSFTSFISGTVPAGTISSSAQITALGFVSSSITASSIITASVTNDDITFTKGDGSQFTIQVATGSFAVSSSYAETASLALNAKDIIVDVKNTTGVQIDKGTVVRIIGSVAASDVALIGTASWEDDNNSANTLGFVTANIPHDSFGTVMTQGTLLGIDTDGFTAGQILYLSSSGQYTNVIPPAPYHEVRLGQVLRVQQNNGSMYVLIQNGYELGELHDVNINTGSLANKDILAYDSASTQWENWSISELGLATTGSNSFNGNQTITGSVTISSSAAIDLTIQGRGLITGPTTGQTPQLLISGSDFNNTIGRSTSYVLEPGRTFGSGYGVGRLDAVTGLNGQALLSMGVFDEPNFITDVELLVQVDTGSGTQFRDIRNDNYNYSTWMSIAPNTGNNPDVVFRRSVDISGSLDIQSTLTASLQQGYVWVGNASGRTTTVATSSFGGGGSAFPFTGTAEITGSLRITGSANTSINATNGTLTQYFGNTFGGNIGLFQNSNGNEIGFALDGAAWGSNWSTGPLLYVNNNPGDSYDGVFGFQNKANFTDGRVTVLKPLDIRGNTTITGSLTASGSVSIQGNTTFTNRSGDTTNVILGSNAMTNITGNVTSNVAIGAGAMRYASGSTQCVALGANALGITTGSNNFAIGAETLASNTTGNQNVAIGVGALNNNKTGNLNTSIGNDSGFRNVSGSRNVYIGPNSGNDHYGDNTVIIGGYSGGGQVLNNNIILSDGNGNIELQYSGSAWTTENNFIVSGSLSAANNIKMGRGTDKPTDKVTVGSGGLIVSNSLVTADSYIFATSDTTVGNYSPVVSNITNGSFSLSNGGYGGNISVMYMIVNPY